MEIPAQLFMAVGKLPNGEEFSVYSSSKESAILLLKEQSPRVVNIKVHVYDYAYGGKIEEI